jgi:hypothetical protein
MTDPMTAFRLEVEQLRDAEQHRTWPGLPSLAGLQGDELDVVGLVVERLALGAGLYGQWVARADMRDLERESLDEELDDVVYRAMRTVRQRLLSEERAEELCSHTGHAGGREGHIALTRGAQPWWRRWFR